MSLNFVSEFVLVITPILFLRISGPCSKQPEKSIDCTEYQYNGRITTRIQTGAPTHPSSKCQVVWWTAVHNSNYSANKFHLPLFVWAWTGWRSHPLNSPPNNLNEGGQHSSPLKSSQKYASKGDPTNTHNVGRYFVGLKAVALSRTKIASGLAKFTEVGRCRISASTWVVGCTPSQLPF